MRFRKLEIIIINSFLFVNVGLEIKYKKGIIKVKVKNSSIEDKHINNAVFPSQIFFSLLRVFIIAFTKLKISKSKSL